MKFMRTVEASTVSRETVVVRSEVRKERSSVVKRRSIVIRQRIDIIAPREVAAKRVVLITVIIIERVTSFVSRVPEMRCDAAIRVHSLSSSTICL